MMKIQHTFNDEHNHDFHESKRHIEKRTLIVVLSTIATMAVEITAGTMFHSMALLADGWRATRAIKKVKQSIDLKTFAISLNID